MTATQIAGLRKIAREHGWQVRTIKSAKRRAAVPLECSRIYRAAWTPGNASGYDQWQYVKVYVSPDETLRAFQTFMPSHPYDGIDAIAAVLRQPIPAEISA